MRENNKREVKIRYGKRDKGKKKKVSEIKKRKNINNNNNKKTSL